MVAANPEVLRLGYKILAGERGIAAVLMPSTESREDSRSVCRAVWENHPYGCALAKDAFRFDSAAMQLGNVFYDG